VVAATTGSVDTGAIRVDSITCRPRHDGHGMSSAPRLPRGWVRTVRNAHWATAEKPAGPRDSAPHRLVDEFASAWTVATMDVGILTPTSALVKFGSKGCWMVHKSPSAPVAANRSPLPVTRPRLISAEAGRVVLLWSLCGRGRLLPPGHPEWSCAASSQRFVSPVVTRRHHRCL
jgi:hypothetical protein